MEADGEHNTRGTANTVTDGQRLDQLEDMVRELYRHVVGNEYSEGETPGPSGNFSNASMGFGANTVDEEFAVENAIDEKSIVTTPKDASDEESGVTGGNANTVTVDIDQRLNRLEDLMGGVVKLLGNKQPGRDNLGERDVSKALDYSDADTPGGESVVNDNGSDSEILEDSNFNPHKCLNKQPFSGDGSPGDSGATAEQITETMPEDGSNEINGCIRE